MKRTLISCLISLAALFILVSGAQAYDRWGVPGDGTNCTACHGAFTDGTSLKGTVFPSNSKHEMHRNGSYMDTDCGYCHTQGDNRNPWLGSSDGSKSGEGTLGCSGCHVGPGLRLHHELNGVDCLSCHTSDPDPVTLSEADMPPSYGTGATLANNPCNDVAQVNINENWSVGDFLGLDNDGDNAYDTADSDCAAGCTVDADCDNGAFCDGTETCDTATGECLAGTSPVIDDGVSCTDDSCDEANDVVVNAPNDSLCDNGDFCDGSETCDAVNDCQAGTPVVCDDDVDCTDDTCNEAADTCVNTPNNANCDDGQFCTGEETCNPVNDCQAGINPCQGTTCNETTDTCEQAGQCGDGNPDPGEECDTGAANGSTTCGCQNDCTYTAATISCDDGLFCNAGETCDGAGTCGGGSPLDCSDGVGCTEDFCDDDANACINIADNTSCPDDGLFCTGTEYCDEVNDCSATGNTCGAGETCNEGTDGYTCDAATCTDIADKGTCQLDPACSWYGKGKNGYCDDAPPPGDCSALGRKDCNADSNCSWVNNQCVDYVPPTCSDFTKKNTCTSNGCSWDQGTRTCN